MFLKVAFTLYPVKDPTQGRIYGPYLRQVPPLPVGDVPARGSTKVGVAGAAAAGDGWAYDEAAGTIFANSPKIGSTGTAYNTW